MPDFAMELDHIFWMVQSQTVAEVAIYELRLVETYRRHHPGQGTSNICCCFDNAFIEFLWITSEMEARSAMTSRLGLFERSHSDEHYNCPFGIAWRGKGKDPTPAMWSCAPSYLPVGMEIAVAASSDDHRLPLLFQSPGISPPINWPEEKRGALQNANGYRAILMPTLSMPKDLTTNATLKWLSDSKIINIATSPDGTYRLAMNISDATGSVATQLVLPLISQIDH